MNTSTLSLHALGLGRCIVSFLLTLLLCQCAQRKPASLAGSLGETRTLTPLSRELDTLLNKSGTPFSIKLTKQKQDKAEEEGKGITAYGLGGLALPLRMELDGLKILSMSSSTSGYKFRAKMDSKVNGIRPWCGKMKGEAILSGPDAPKLILPDFYCNWAVIGNVAVELTLSVESVDLKTSSFQGRYRLKFIGTGNALGSGRFSAVVQP